MSRAIIIGAGPAGLTAAHELAVDGGPTPVVYEASDEIGGISRTIRHGGNRMDIGGHRFFSRSERVMQWWQQILPIEQTPATERFRLAHQGQSRDLPGGDGADPERIDDVMLVRSRLSRIYYDQRFFNYPITLEWSTLRNLGLRRIVRMGLSYLAARVRPRAEETLEDFYVNRFGRELYNTFFRDYTEKVWGVPCREIAPDWGAQRVKGLSVTTTLAHAARALVRRIVPRRGPTDLGQTDTEVSLIEHFLYPKLGPGHMWERVADRVRDAGGEVHLERRVVGIHTEGDRVRAVDLADQSGTGVESVTGEQFLSTIPVKDLVAAMVATGTEVPAEVVRIASALPYRDFLTVGLSCRRLLLNDPRSGPGRVPDNWIYIQEPGVRVGRLQVFNNWSPWLVSDPEQVWLGLEYFCTEGDDLWSRSDEDMTAFAVAELARIGIVDPDDVVDSCVVRVPKTYPAYFGSYREFDVVRAWLDRFTNLWLVGRNGQHRYNNQDHSMLTAMAAVEAIRAGSTDKAPVWAVNLEAEYHEESGHRKEPVG